MQQNVDVSKINIAYKIESNSFKLSFVPEISLLKDVCYRHDIEQFYSRGDFNFEAKIDNPCPITGCLNDGDKKKMQDEIGKIEKFVFSSLMNYPFVKRTIVKTHDDLKSIIRYENDNNELLRNYDVRGEEVVIDTLVMHYTVINDTESFKTLTTPRGVSAHYLVYENGEVMQLVGEDKVAWHAGPSSWKGIPGVNKRSIGIEIVNKGIYDTDKCTPYTEAQINAVKILSLDILARNPNISPSKVVGHSDVAPDRKFDPGPCFPWPELAQSKIGVFPNVTLPTENNVIFKVGDSGPEIVAWKKLIHQVGYAVTDNDEFGEQEKDVSNAFHSHYLATYPVNVWDEHSEIMLMALVKNDIEQIV